jgi:hypothetical protein
MAVGNRNPQDVSTILGVLFFIEIENMEQGSFIKTTFSCCPSFWKVSGMAYSLACFYYRAVFDLAYQLK